MTIKEKRVVYQLIKALEAEREHDADWENDCAVCKSMRAVNDLLGYKYEWLTDEPVDS